MSFEPNKEELMWEFLSKPPRERARSLEHSSLTPAEREEVRRLGDVADSVWLEAQEAPPLEQDPAARLLGLVPSAEESLDPKQLTRLRKNAGMNVDDLASRLRSRGWDVEHTDVIAWESPRRAAEVPPAIIEAIAQTLGVPIERLVRPLPSPQQDSLRQQLRQHPAFEELARRWSRLKQVSIDAAEGALAARALATVHRGQIPDLDQSVASLKTLVTAMEDRESEGRP